MHDHQVSVEFNGPFAPRQVVLYVSQLSGQSKLDTLYDVLTLLVLAPKACWASTLNPDIKLHVQTVERPHNM